MSFILFLYFSVSYLIFFIDVLINLKERGEHCCGGDLLLFFSCLFCVPALSESPVNEWCRRLRSTRQKHVSSRSWPWRRRSLTLHINASRRLHRVFWERSVYLISKECWHGSSFHGNTLQTASVAVMCHICFSDCVSGKDTEVCSVLGRCILSVWASLWLCVCCLWVWGL